MQMDKIKKISQNEAVRQALARTEPFKSNGDAIAWIKAEFDIDVKPMAYATLKCAIKKQMRAGEKPKRKAKAAANGYAVREDDVGDPFSLVNDMLVFEQIRTLVRTHGARAVRLLVDDIAAQEGQEAKK
jgi:hypothetical protein